VGENPPDLSYPALCRYPSLALDLISASLEPSQTHFPVPVAGTFRR
jgi:hypothetical protein